MKVFLLSYEGLDFSETGVLALYSNIKAANEALEYAEALGRYYKLYIEECFIFDKFLNTDFD